MWDCFFVSHWWLYLSKIYIILCTINEWIIHPTHIERNVFVVERFIFYLFTQVWQCEGEGGVVKPPTPSSVGSNNLLHPPPPPSSLQFCSHQPRSQDIIWSCSIAVVFFLSYFKLFTELFAKIVWLFNKVAIVDQRAGKCNNIKRLSLALILRLLSSFVCPTDQNAT